MLLDSRYNSTFSAALRRQGTVMYAIMLRNMRTKFFGSGAGYVLSILWPLSHIVVLVGLYAATGRLAPYGDSITLFVSTGIVPFQTFNYLSRFMMFSLIKNKPLLNFPAVKALDMLFASAILETLSACSVAIIFLIVAWTIGIDPMPRDIVQASCAFGAALLLGLGFGLVNGVIALGYPQWFTGYALVQVILWITSGIFFVPDALPPTVREFAAWHPILQSIEWMRSAYYEGYGNIVLDRSYPIIFGVTMVFLGLLLERLTRGAVLASR